MKSLLKMMDLNRRDVFQILDLADQLKYEKHHGMEHKLIPGKTIGLIFDKASTRTRVSFEAGAYQLGAKAMFLSSRDLQMERGEPIQDTARVLSRYLDCVILRTSNHKDVEIFEKYATIPVINGLTDFAHPCQTLADLMTIKEKFGALEGLKLCYIGDGTSTCNSLIVGALIMEMNVSVATPKGYEPSKEVLEYAYKFENFNFGNCPKEAIKEADIVVTDTWASMGVDDLRDIRIKDFAGYTLNEELMNLAKPNAMVQHPLPAYRGQEITEDVFEKHADEIFDEAENRLHVQNAILVSLLKDSPL